MESLDLKEVESEIHEANYNTNESLFYRVTKRIIDIIGSIAALILFSPVMIIISILIKLDSEGPVIFSHKRLGKNGINIKVYKFRSMVIDAEKVLDNLPPEKKIEFEKNFKLKDDSRITKIGKFLRETSLDELPQFFNVLIGNMSLVGPRPIIEKEKIKYGQTVKKLLSVKPGITGNWQVNGRSNTTYEERIELDMYYIDNRSLFFDIKLIFKTIIVVFKRTGAR